MDEWKSGFFRSGRGMTFPHHPAWPALVMSLVERIAVRICGWLRWEYREQRRPGRRASVSMIVPRMVEG